MGKITVTLNNRFSVPIGGLISITRLPYFGAPVALEPQGYWIAACDPYTETRPATFDVEGLGRFAVVLHAQADKKGYSVMHLVKLTRRRPEADVRIVAVRETPWTRPY